MIEIKGNLINLKSVVIQDAKFILKLRKNKELNKYISPTNINLENQKKWIESYLKKQDENKEFYFIVQNKKNESCGTVRIYNVNTEKKECIWGSFILDKNRPDGASYEAIKLSLKYAFEILKIKKVLLDVRKENKKAIYIYEKNGFKRYNEDDLNYYYEKVKEEKV
ncbi:MAG: GNAT family N-acetyltransferase [Cetobacterium sp.]